MILRRFRTVLITNRCFLIIAVPPQFSSDLKQVPKMKSANIYSHNSASASWDRIKKIISNSTAVQVNCYLLFCTQKALNHPWSVHKYIKPSLICNHKHYSFLDLYTKALNFPWSDKKRIKPSLICNYKHETFLDLCKKTFKLPWFVHRNIKLSLLWLKEH